MFKTRENVPGFNSLKSSLIIYTFSAKSSVTSEATESSEIQTFSLKGCMFSINAMNFGNVRDFKWKLNFKDSKWNHRLIRYTKSAIF